MVRFPRLDVAASMAAIDPEVHAYYEREKKLNDELERYRRDRDFSKTKHSNTLLTTDGSLSDRVLKVAPPPKLFFR
jgi:hypothetical protein